MRKAKRATTDFRLPFSHSGSTKTNFIANFWLLMLDQKSFFLSICVSVDSTYPNIDRKGHQANKGTSFGASGIGVLVLPES